MREYKEFCRQLETDAATFDLEQANTDCLEHLTAFEFGRHVEQCAMRAVLQVQILIAACLGFVAGAAAMAVLRAWLE